MTEIDSAKTATSLTPDARRDIQKLAKRQQAAGGLLMSVVNYVGGTVENMMEKLPDGIKNSIERTTASALEYSYVKAAGARSSNYIPDIGSAGHGIAAMISGGAGGFGGLASSVAELPVTVTIIFAAIQKVAAGYGFDPDDEEIKSDCLQIFAAGNPGTADDGMNTSFITSRIVLQGPAVQAFIAKIAPDLAIILTQKLAAQAVPVLGAVAGAGINYAFVSYYQELAHIRFGLRKLALSHGAAEVADAFRLSLDKR